MRNGDIDFFYDSYDKVKLTWHTAKYGDPYLESMLCVYPSKCTHIAVNAHTHTVNTHPEQSAAIYAAVPGEQLGVRCLAQGHLIVVLKVERVLVIHSPHRLSTIRPWLPSPVDCRMTLTNTNGSLMGHHSILLGLPYYYSTWKCFHLAILCLI